MPLSTIKKKYIEMSKPTKAALWFVVCGFMQKGISTLTTPIFTRLLSTSEYGIYSTFNAWLDLLTIFVTLKLGSSVYMQGLVKYEDDRPRYTSSLLGLATTTTFVAFIIYLLFRSFINEVLGFNTLLIICMFIMMWTTLSFDFWSSLQRVNFEYRKLIIITIIVTVAKPALSILGIYLFPSAKVEARIVAITFVEIVCYSFLYFSLIGRGKVFYEHNYWKYAVAYNLPLIPHFLSQTILNQSDRIMINNMVGLEPAGIYSLAYNISMIMLIFNTAINNTMNPWIYRNIKDKTIEKIGKASYPLFVFVACINIVLILTAPEIISIFAPASYREAIYVISPVAMAVYFRFTYVFFASFELYFEKTRWTMYASLVGAILNLVLNYLFIPKYGYIAAAYTTLFCYIVYSVMHYCMMVRTCNLYLEGNRPYDLRILLIVTLCFLIAGFLIMSIYEYAVIRYIFFFLLVIIAFVNRKKIVKVFQYFR